MRNTFLEQYLALYMKSVVPTDFNSSKISTLSWADISKIFPNVTAHGTEGSLRTITLSDEVMSTLIEFHNR